MSRPLLVFAAVLTLAACGRGSETPIVRDAWVRLPAVPGRPAAAYFTLEGGRRDDALVRVESAVAGRIELHRQITGHHGMSGMAPLARVEIPAGAKVAFAPGGRHAMVYAVDPAIRPGTELPLRFGFASGATFDAGAKFVAAGAAQP